MRKAKGFMFFDVIIGLTLLGMVASLLAIAVNRQLRPASIAWPPSAPPCAAPKPP